MRTKLATLVISFACLAFGQHESGNLDVSKLQVSKTETAEFPANGTLRIQKSVGEITIEGWDQPGFEITTTRSMQDDVAAKDRDKAKQSLDAVHVAITHQGSDLIVTTEYPHRGPGGRNFDLEYRIRVPRTASIVVERHTGEVHIDDVTGDVRASVGGGLIAMRLAGEKPLAIDARSKWGSVNSDYAGKETRRPFPFGHTFAEPPSTDAQKLHLRVGFGDIILLKEHNPRAPAPIT
jgi:hypothetical protein